MKQIQANLTDLITRVPTVVTTNGTVRKNGSANMGRGNALQVSKLLPWIPEKLGLFIQEKGNHVHFLGEGIISFPVEHSWIEQADLLLIQRSLGELVVLTDKMQWNEVYLPLPGCGGGGLSPEEVFPLLHTTLDDRFTLVSFD